MFPRQAILCKDKRDLRSEVAGMGSKDPNQAETRINIESSRNARSRSAVMDFGQATLIDGDIMPICPRDRNSDDILRQKRSRMNESILTWAKTFSIMNGLKCMLSNPNVDEPVLAMRIDRVDASECEKACGDKRESTVQRSAADIGKPMREHKMTEELLPYHPKLLTANALSNVKESEANIGDFNRVRPYVRVVAPG